VVRVKNNKNGREALVRINDRGPFVRGRIIDLTPAGAKALGFAGVANVSLTIASSSSN
jgi:rare lipoprotein A